MCSAGVCVVWGLEVVVWCFYVCVCVREGEGVCLREYGGVGGRVG